jgi:hypothetical protein
MPQSESSLMMAVQKLPAHRQCNTSMASADLGQQAHKALVVIIRVLPALQTMTDLQQLHGLLAFHIVN